MNLGFAKLLHLEEYGGSFGSLRCARHAIACWAFSQARTDHVLLTLKVSLPRTCFLSSFGVKHKIGSGWGGQRVTLVYELKSVDQLGSDGFWSPTSNSGHSVFFFSSMLGSFDFRAWHASVWDFIHRSANLIRFPGFYLQVKANMAARKQTYIDLIESEVCSIASTASEDYEYIRVYCSGHSDKRPHLRHWFDQLRPCVFEVPYPQPHVLLLLSGTHLHLHSSCWLQRWTCRSSPHLDLSRWRWRGRQHVWQDRAGCECQQRLCRLSPIVRHSPCTQWFLLRIRLQNELCVLSWYLRLSHITAAALHQLLGSRSGRRYQDLPGWCYLLSIRLDTERHAHAAKLGKRILLFLESCVSVVLL